MSDDIVVLQEYANEIEAQLAAVILEANGIETQVLADTAGGALPSMAFVFPVRLLVRSVDADVAREILQTSVEPTPEDDSEST
jgi:putative signal transducing protein